MEKKDEDVGTACNIHMNGRNDYPLALLQAENPAEPSNQLCTRFQKSSQYFTILLKAKQGTKAYLLGWIKQYQ